MGQPDTGPNLMKFIINLLIKLITLISKNITATILTIILVAVIGLVFHFGKITNLLNHHFPSPATESSRWGRIITSNNDINNILITRMSESGAGRIGIRQFHNGKTDLTGLPFNFVTTTFLQEKNPSGTNSFDAVPVSTINDLLMSMWPDLRNPRCTYMETPDISNISFRHQLESVDVSRFYACPIYNINKWPVGYLFLGYTSKDTQTISTEEALDALEKDSLMVSGYLTYVTEHERTKFLGFF